MSIAASFRALLLAFFLLMLVFPTTWQVERGVLLALLLAGGALHALYAGWSINRTILGWSLLTVTVGLFFMWQGAIYGAPGALRVGTVHVLWPLIYLFFIGFVRSPETLVALQKAILVCVLIAATLGIGLVLGTLAGYGDLLAESLQAHDVAAGMYDGYARYRMANIPTVIYGAGFVLALIFARGSDRWCSRGWTVVAWGVLPLMLAAIVLSGRRAAWLVAILAPFIVLALALVAGRRLQLRPWIALAVIGVLMGLGLIAWIDIEPEALIRQFANAFDFSAEQSASVRGDQWEALIGGWQERPLFGHGLGEGTYVVRNWHQPWAYELSYVALLFQTGIVGVLVYAAAVAWIFWAGIRTMRRVPESTRVMLPLLCGLTGFLIANGTNPYLAKFDYLWVLFLPIAAIRLYALEPARRGLVGQWRHADA